MAVAGPTLSGAEASLLAERPPAGVILFQRNCIDRAQLRTLIDALRTAAGRPDLLVLIDQEGGRVMRLKPPHWRSLPAMAVIGALARHSLVLGERAAWLVGRLIAHDLREVGIDAACAPVLDVVCQETTLAIGDRSFGEDPALVATLGRAVIAGLIAGGVMTVVKHLPGHGRARVDSHLELPRVDASLDALRACDFHPFAACSQSPLGMTAHVVYEALDHARPATLSPLVIGEVIRGLIGFRGILLSDDLDMAALDGAIAERASAALDAGCDLALVCKGNLDDTAAVLDAVPVADGALLARLTGLRAQHADEPFDCEAAAADLELLLATS